MADNYNEIINQLSQKIHAVISLYERTKREKQELEEQNQQLEKELKHQKAYNTDLNNKLSTLRIARQMSSAEEHDSSEAKAQINKLVREIDKCIALLNK